MNRILVIGDLHGGFLGLKQAIERANVTATDTLIFLGDYVDGWHDTVNLVEYLMSLQETNNCIFIRGNHDWWFEDYIEYSSPSQSWLQHGGQTTLKNYRENGLIGEESDSERFEKHKEFFKNLIPFYIDEENRIFLHGGYSTMDSINIKHIDVIYWDRALFQTAFEMHSNYNTDEERNANIPLLLTLYKEIYVGHTSSLYYGTDKPLNGFNLWNLDTGAGTNGKVTIMDVDTKEFWQSDLLRELYSNDTHIHFCNSLLR